MKTNIETPMCTRNATDVQLAYQKRLNHITQHIHAAPDTDDILLNLQGEILRLLDADRITVYAVDGIKREIVSKLKTGNDINEIRIPINSGSIAGYCAESLDVINILNVLDQKELTQINPNLKFDQTWDRATGYQTSQVLAAPIIHNQRLQGVIQLMNKKNGGRFTAEDQSSVLDIAKVLGTAFHKNQRVAEKAQRTRFDFLVARNIVSREELATAMVRARQKHLSVESVLMTEFQVPKDEIGKSLSFFHRTRFIPFDRNMVIPEELLRNLRMKFLKKNRFMPVARTGDSTVVAMEDPGSLPARDAVKMLIHSPQFEYCVSLREDIFKMIDLFFDRKKAQSLPKGGSIEDILGQLKTLEEEEDVTGDSMEDDSVIVRLVNKMISDAYVKGASDIHIEPGSGKKPAVIRIRVDGSCRIYQTIPAPYKRTLVSRIKIMSDLDIAERRLPQDGKIKFKRFAPLDIELRVATIPTAGGNEDVVMRILKSGAPMPLEKMGMTERDYHTFMRMITKPYGMILVVGPTGSGKTTTLHSAIHHINKPEIKIWTAEDPVEISQDGLRQLQVNPKIGLNFAAAMRSFLRADPDVIMVGEMRDRETMSMGIEASLTGHLVFSTLHTNSAPETVTRLLDMGMDSFNFADALLGILAQRLARTLCVHCKEPYHPPRTEYDGLMRAYAGNVEALGFGYHDDFRLYRARGCPECHNSGYQGRTALFELLLATDDMKAMIQDRANIDQLRTQAAKADGMTTLMQDGIRKVFLGLTDIQQVRRVCIR